MHSKKLGWVCFFPVLYPFTMPAVFSKCVFISGTASYIVFTSALIYRNIEHKPRARTARCRLSSRCSKPVGASSWNLPWLLKTNQTKNLKCNTERALKLQGVTGFPHPAPHYCSCDRGPIPTEPHGHMAAPHIYRAWWRYPKLSIPIQHPEICFIYRNVYNGSDKNPAPHSCQGLGRRVGTATGGPVLQDVGWLRCEGKAEPFLGRRSNRSCKLFSVHSLYPPAAPLQQLCIFTEERRKSNTRLTWNSSFWAVYLLVHWVRSCQRHPWGWSSSHLLL